MWKCNKCGENVEDSFDACWKCGTSKDGVEDSSFQSAVVPETDADEPKMGHPAPRTIVELEASAAAKDHLVARGLIWVLRGLAVIGAIWGMMNIINTMDVARTTSMAAARFRDFPNRASTDVRENMADSVQRAASMSVFTAVIIAAAVVAVPMALAELLRLFVLIERNTRASGQPNGRLTKRSA